MPEITMEKWTGSWVTDLREESLVPGDFKDIKNLVYRRTGPPEVRPGRALLDDRHAYITGVSSKISFLSPFVAGGKRYLMVFLQALDMQDGGVLVAWSTRGDTFIALTDRAVVKDELYSDGGFVGVSAQNRFFFSPASNSDTRLYVWSPGGSGDIDTDDVSIVTGAPRVKHIFYHNSRLWIVEPNAPSTLKYSVLREPENWDVGDGAGTMPIEPDDGDIITAMISYMEQAIIFKDGDGGGSIHRLSGWTDEVGTGVDTALFSKDIWVKNLGAVSRNAIFIGSDKDIYFGSRIGIHALSRTDKYGDLESAFIDFEVNSQWRDLALDQKQNAIFVNDANVDRFYVSFDDDFDEFNDTTLVFHYARHGPTRIVNGQEMTYPSVSYFDYGFDAGVMYHPQFDQTSRLITASKGMWGTREASVLFIENTKDYTDKDVNSTGLENIDVTTSATLWPIYGGDHFRWKSWGTLYLRYINWGNADLTVTYWPDNAPESSGVISMNQADFPIPYNGDTIGGEFRSVPDDYAVQSPVLMRIGGVRLNLKFESTMGYYALMGMKFYMEMMEHLGHVDWSMPSYSKTRDGV